MQKPFIPPLAKKGKLNVWSWWQCFSWRIHAGEYFDMVCTVTRAMHNEWVLISTQSRFLSSWQPHNQSKPSPGPSTSSCTRKAVFSCTKAISFLSSFVSISTLLVQKSSHCPKQVIQLMWRKFCNWLTRNDKNAIPYNIKKDIMLSWLTVQSMGHSCNKDTFSTFIEMNLVQWILAPDDHNTAILHTKSYSVKIIVTKRYLLLSDQKLHTLSNNYSMNYITYVCDFVWM